MEMIYHKNNGEMLENKILEDIDNNIFDREKFIKENNFIVVMRMK